MNGFVSRAKVNEILGYKLGNPLRSFGDRHSGLKRLTESQYNRLVEEFKKHPRSIPVVKKGKKNGWNGNEGGESIEHQALKNYVASNPATILNELVLTTVMTEYPFPSGDRADVVLQDKDGRIVGVEIEFNVSDKEIVGVLQAIKYRYMLALMEERRYFETRAFLVAKTISRVIKRLCDQYEVEYFEVNHLLE